MRKGRFTRKDSQGRYVDSNTAFDLMDPRHLSVAIGRDYELPKVWVLRIWGWEFNKPIKVETFDTLRDAKAVATLFLDHSEADLAEEDRWSKMLVSYWVDRNWHQVYMGWLDAENDRLRAEYDTRMAERNA